MKYFIIILLIFIFIGCSLDPDNIGDLIIITFLHKNVYEIKNYNSFPVWVDIQETRIDQSGKTINVRTMNIYLYSDYPSIYEAAGNKIEVISARRALSN